MSCIRISMFFALAICACAGHAQSVVTPASVKPRYALKQLTAEEAPQRSQRYAIRARFAAAESAGDLHEGAKFTLIGKFATAGASCSAFALFSNGFEAN